MRENEKAEFSQYLTGVLDVYGAKATPASLGIWWAALAKFSLEKVRASLSAHVQDPIAGKFAPKPADLIGRLQESDGRPGPEESWAMMPRDESVSVVWTQEMATAWGAALPLLNEGESVGARMAFLERYKQLVAKARAEGEPPKWSPSLGTDMLGREKALMEAVELQRLPYEHIAGLLPFPERPAVNTLRLIQQKHALLTAPKPRRDCARRKGSDVSVIPETAGQA